MDTKKLINDLANEAKLIIIIRPPHIRSIKWFAIALIYISGLIFTLDLRFDIAEKLQETLFVIEIAIALAGAIFAGLAAAYMAVPDSYQKGQIKWLALLPFVALAAILTYQFINPVAKAGAPLNATLSSYQCFADMLLFSIFPIIVMFFYIRRGATTACCWCGAMASLSAVNFSYISLRLIEPNDVIKHLFFWHYTPMVVAVLIGVLLGNRLLRW